MAFRVQRRDHGWVVLQNGIEICRRTTREEAVQAGGASAFSAKVAGERVTLTLEDEDGVSAPVDLDSVVAAIRGAFKTAPKPPKPPK